MRYLEIPLSIR